MSPKGENRFCSNCEKVVIDFTNKSPEEIVSYLNRHPKTCGHFKKIQLNQLNQITKHKNPFTKYAAVFAVTAFLGIYSPMEARTFAPKIEQEDQNQWKSVLSKKPLNDSITLKGMVKDSDDLPVPGVNIFVKGKTTGTITDFEGKFELVLSRDEL
jgi:hypothetical protein